MLRRLAFAFVCAVTTRVSMPLMPIIAAHISACRTEAPNNIIRRWAWIQELPYYYSRPYLYVANGGCGAWSFDNG
jgi:hypothetical protein